MLKKSALIPVFALAAASLAFAQGPIGPDPSLVQSFPDSSDLRSKLFSSLIGAPRDLALAYGEKVLQSAAGPVLARASKRADDFLVEFRVGTAGSFDAIGRGSCVIQRSNAKGNYILQARVYLQDDPACYLRLYPNPRNSGTLADLVMYGALLKQGISVGGMLYQVLIKPFSWIVETTARSFDWALVFPRGGSAPRGAESSEASSSYDQEWVEALAAAASAQEFLSAAAGAVEVSSPGAAPLGLSPERGAIGQSAAYSAFPPYVEGKGIQAAALRALLYFDWLEHPDASYALFGAGLRSLAVPSLDPEGRLAFRALGPGGEAGLEALLAQGSPVRALRLPPPARR